LRIFVTRDRPRCEANEALAQPHAVGHGQEDLGGLAEVGGSRRPTTMSLSIPGDTARPPIGHGNSVWLIDGPIAANPHRVGKPLEEPFDSYHSARRGTYRVIYRIDQAARTVEIHSVRHRRDAYRA
jgi:hypothetical protein